MLKEYKKIDGFGLVVDSFVFNPDTDVIPADCVPSWDLTAGIRFHKPRYNFETKKWAEGLVQADIDLKLYGPLDVHKKTKDSELNQACSAAIYGGFSFRLNETDYHFTYDREDQINFQDTYLLFENNMVPSIRWSAYLNGEKIRLLLTKEVFIQIYLSSVKHKNSCLSYYHENRLLFLRTATTYAEVNAIEWSMDEASDNLVIDETNTIEKKLESADGVKSEVEAQKEYNVYLEATVLELADILLMTMM